jgi:rhodanese-related sulfurtransferase
MISMTSCHGQQKATPQNHVSNPEFDKTIRSYLSFSVPTIDVDILHKDYDQYYILDARESEEYQLSHLPGAVFVGYKNPSFDLVNRPDDMPVVVYCSIGYRSEKIAEILQSKGIEVYNLYGSIFEWVNKGYALEDQTKHPTFKVHGYNKSWSKWIQNPKYDIEY